MMVYVAFLRWLSNSMSMTWSTGHKKCQYSSTGMVYKRKEESVKTGISGLFHAMEYEAATG